MTPKIYAIGDIHGMSSLLKILLVKLFEEKSLDLSRDKIIFMGDYVDRGPNSAEVIRVIRAFQEIYPNNIVALYGNHEDLMLSAIDTPPQKPNHDLYWHGLEDNDPWYWWIVNGGGETLASFGAEKLSDFTKIPADVIDWIRNLKLEHHEHGFHFTHAPLPRENRRIAKSPNAPFSKEEIIWSHPGGDEWGWARPMGNEEDGTPIIGICGHVKAASPKGDKPRVFEHYIYTDTGCGCHPKRGLAAIELHSKEVIMAMPSEVEAFKERIEEQFA